MLIVVDDLGWNGLGCTGSAFYETPNIDHLAARGMRFTQAYSSAPVCSPTRAVLLTGKRLSGVGPQRFIKNKGLPWKNDDWTGLIGCFQPYKIGLFVYEKCDLVVFDLNFLGLY